MDPQEPDSQGKIPQRCPALSIGQKVHTQIPAYSQLKKPKPRHQQSKLTGGSLNICSLTFDSTQEPKEKIFEGNNKTQETPYKRNSPASFTSYS